jgi:hypothetical protein
MLNNLALSLYKDVQDKLPAAPLSQILPIALRLARSLTHKPFEKWIKFETGGYFKENGMADGDRVPEYRVIVGQHLDILKRPFLVPDPKLSFVNEYYLRFGVEELETMARRADPIVIQDQDVIDSIRELCHGKVYAFSFSPISVSGVLPAIRSRLSSSPIGVKQQKGANFVIL